MTIVLNQISGSAFLVPYRSSMQFRLNSMAEAGLFKKFIENPLVSLCYLRRNTIFKIVNCEGDNKQRNMETEANLKSFFVELFDYNRQANEVFITQLNANEKRLNEKCVSLINHIINAHQIWNNRIEKKELAYGVWEIHKFNDLKLLNNSNHEVSKELIFDYSLYLTVDYRNTKGELYSNSARDVLFHIINHSNYHRAQIAANLKSLGIDPPKSDYIVYKR